ncbi:MAG: transglutaminaseTgpA domain-containing protein [Acidobacteriia bacterium]|nr:transglutaminaseTgpA domain-containing protein [Terriglobia bacterium]
MAKAASIDPAELSRPQTHVSVQRYFETSLLLMLGTAFVTVASTGKLDLVSVFVVSAALLVKLWSYLGERDVSLGPRTVTRLAVFYIFFYVLDFLIFSVGPSLMDSMLSATVHLVLFTAVIKVFSARTYRDYAYLATLSFMMMLASAILTVGTVYLACFTFYMLFAISTLISYEIKRSVESSRRPPEGPFRVPAQNRTAIEKALSTATVGLGVSIVVLASVLFFVIPRYRTGYLTGLGMEAQNITGFSGTVNLGDIRKILRSNLVVMRVIVEGDPRVFQGVKWRGVGLTSFDGKNWYNDNTEQRVVSPASFQRYVIPYPAGWHNRRSRPLRYRLLLSPLSTDVLFVASVPVDITGRLHSITQDQTDSLHYPGHGYSPFSYVVLSDAGLPSPAELRRAPSDYPAEIRRIYLLLPDLDPRVAELAKQVTAPAANNYDRAVALEQHLRSNYTYTLDPTGIDANDPVASFLFQARSGYCEYFAAAMAVMLRTQGIPARLVNGFQTGTYNRVGKDFIVRGRDAHSWVEVYFPDYGWIPFDPTPADPNPVVAGAFDDYLDAVSLFWSEWIINYDFAHQAQLARDVERDSRQIQQDFQKRVRRFQRLAIRLAYRVEGWLMSHKLLVFLIMLAILGALIAAEKGDSIAELRFLLAWRFRRRDRALSPAEATLTYGRFLKTLHKKGFRKPLSQTPREFAFSFVGTRLSWPVLEFTRLYNALRFGSAAVSLARLRTLLEEIAASK